MCQIANTVSELRFTYDCPSKNSTKCVPVLDVQMWVSTNNKVLYKFYKKPCSSPYTLLKRSAIPESTKRETNFQEGLRRLSRTSLEVDWSTRQQDLAEYSMMLKLPGYSQEYRRNTLSGILKRWDTVQSEIKSGNREFHRTR